MIYFICNPAENTMNYVCPNQQTIDVGINMGYKGIYSIGNEADANNILLQNQQAFLSANVNLFVVNLQTVVSGGITWVPVDLVTEPDNTNRIYRLLNIPNGDYVEAIGLDDAKILEAQIKNNFLAFNTLVNYTASEFWPDLPQPVKP